MRQMSPMKSTSEGSRPHWLSVLTAKQLFAQLLLPRCLKEKHSTLTLQATSSALSRCWKRCHQSYTGAELHLTASD